MKMSKNILFIAWILAIFLIAACAPAEQPTQAPQPTQPEAPGEAAGTGEASIDDVGAAINSIEITEGDLDDSDLEDLDSVMEDIENI